MKFFEPRVPDMIEDDGSIPSYREFDELVLTESGYDVDSEKGQEIMNNVVANSTDDKIFTVRDSDNSDDKLKQSFKIDDTVYAIITNEYFDEYWRQHILKNLDSEKDKKLLEQCDDDSFIGDSVYKKLNELGKLEVFYYIDFFREILGISDNEDSMNLVELDDELIKNMPNVMRIY